VPRTIDAELGRPTQRSQAKADRRASLLDAASELFAQRGFNGVSIEDLGAAVGVSGPAVYRHFSGKQAVLAAILVGVSRDLLAGGIAVVEQAPDDEHALTALIRFHVNFALANPDVIRVQDRDLDSLAEGARREVRSLQRRYVEQWAAVLERLRPSLDVASARIRVQATFGLINSTPHSTQAHGREIDADDARRILEVMALAGLRA
jgi:AcrR family transcriptional regulator